MQEENNFFQTFFYHGNQIRTVEQHGEPWFVVKDVCDALEINNASLAINGNPSRNETGLDEDEKGMYIVNTSGGPQRILCINESGFYRLIAKCQKPEAKIFERWLYHEVLPAIGRICSYSPPPQKQPQQLLQGMDWRSALMALSEDELIREIHYQRAMLVTLEAVHNYKYSQAKHVPRQIETSVLLSVEAESYLLNMPEDTSKYSQKNNSYKHDIIIGPDTKALLQHLDALDRPGCFDSRALFTFVQREAKSTHIEWMNFIHYHQADFERFNPLDIRIALDNEEFAMLSIDQGCILLLLGYLPVSSSFTTLLDYLHDFRTNYPANRFIGGNLLVTYSIERYVNKTLEEADAKEEKVDKVEKRLEKLFGAHLEAQGITVQYQVRCENGIADIVTPDAIYELKASLSKKNLQNAIGQVLAYRACINPSAKAAVVGYPFRNEAVDLQFAESIGVEIIVWTDK